MAEEIPGLAVRVEATVAKFDASLKRAQAVLNRGADGMERRARRLNAELANTGADFGNNLKNASFQIQDVAVQMAAGTSAAQALSMQLPQLLSGFGLFGAIAGTAAAVLLPLTANLLGTRDAAEVLKEKLTTLEQAIQSAKAAGQDFSSGFIEQQQAFFGAATALDEFTRARVELENTIALDAASAAMQELVGRYEEFIDTNKEAVAIGTEFEAFNAGVRAISSEFNIATGAAAELQNALIAATSALSEGNGVAALNALEQIRSILGEARKNTEDFSAEGEEAYQQFLQLEAALRRAFRVIEDNKAALDPVVVAANAFADAAARTAISYAEAAANAAEAAANMPADIAALATPDAFPTLTGDINSALVAAGLPVGGIAPTATNRPRPAITGTRRTPSGSSTTTKDAYTQEIEAINQRIAALKVEISTYGMSEAAKARYRVETELIAAAEKDGLEISDERRKQIEELGAATEAYVTQLEAWAEAEEYAREKQAEAMEAAERGNTTLADTASTLIDAAKGANSFADALQNVAIELLKMATQGLLNQGPLASLLGGFLGLGGYSASGSIGGTLGTGGVSPTFSAAPPAPAPVPALATAAAARDVSALFSAAPPAPVFAAPAAGSSGGSFAPVINIDARFATEGTAELVEKRVSRAVSDIARNIRPMIRASQKAGRP